MGAAKSRNEVELRYFVTDLNQVIEKELPSNRDLLARVTQMGALDRGGAAGMAPANVAYTSYMRSLALHGGPLEIMASLLPCAWSYIEIATALADRVDPDHPVYADWVGYFSLPQNVEMVGEMRRDFDRLVADEASGQARWEEIERIFATSSRLEHQFWEMAYKLERWPDLSEDYATP
jgi:thiaminase/transcriptional activator TenA